MGQFILTVPGTTATTYIATGTEGMVVPFPGLFGRTIDLVTYNTLVLIPETPATLDAQGYYYNNATKSLVLGFPLNEDDVLQILFS